MKTLAFMGKGGTGKTVLSALTAKIAVEKGLKTLVIDADPATGCAMALGADRFVTVGEARLEIIRQASIAKQDETARLSEIIDYLILSALTAVGPINLLVMGKTETSGCFCSVNNLLRETISRIADSFDIIIIDAEAGIEQINRQVTKTVNAAFFVTDNSRRGINTTLLALKTLKDHTISPPETIGTIFNRVDYPDEELVDILKENEMPVIGLVPQDQEVTTRDSMGLPLSKISDTSISMNALDKIFKKINFF
ncbi:AAA family ATPase [Myxococcota bacterium]|nr:AAA family ATPase [Myxococcota bacterium]MBU1380309.1 AAA family ATPase [Myxococcota bacterium]MBU1495297.1 AAA family ATPase [Myxococcota bacterium]